jgi:hypothetical protein
MHRRLEGAPVVTVINSLVVQRVAPAGMGRVERLAVVFIQSDMRIDIALRAHALQYFQRSVLLALESAGHYALERHTAFREVFAKPARLLPAQIRQTIVVGGPERGLAVTDQEKQCHGETRWLRNPAV